MSETSKRGLVGPGGGPDIVRAVAISVSVLASLYYGSGVMAIVVYVLAIVVAIRSRKFTAIRATNPMSSMLETGWPATVFANSLGISPWAANMSAISAATSGGFWASLPR